MKFTVGIVDDNNRISQQIAEKLLLTDDVDILFIVESGKEALEWLMNGRKAQPQIILMDIEMPGMNGIETTFKVKDLHPNIKIIMLTVFDNEVNIFNAIKSGASGYLLKDETLPRMMEAFNDVLEGGVPMSPAIARKSMEMMISGYKPGKQILYTESQEELTRRETEILEMMAEGQNIAKIAGTLFISPFTVKKHIENIYGKLHIKSRTELLLWYQQA